MDTNETLQCHAILTVLRFKYSATTIDGPFYRYIGVCDLLNVDWDLWDVPFNTSRWNSLPKISLIPTTGTKTNTHGWLLFLREIEDILLRVSDDQYTFILGRINQQPAVGNIVSGETTKSERKESVAVKANVLLSGYDFAQMSKALAARQTGRRNPR